MATEALVQKVKHLLSLSKAGNNDEAYAGYKELFLSPEFATYPMEEQRHAIKIVVNARIPPTRPAPSLVAAYKAAMTPLAKILSAENEPADYELLGICHVFMGDDKKAAELFRAGLTMERERNPQSNLCGSLMKWVAAV